MLTRRTTCSLSFALFVFFTSTLCHAANKVILSPVFVAKINSGLLWEDKAADAYDEGNYALAATDARTALTFDPWVSFEPDEILAACANAEGKSDEAFQRYSQLITANHIMSPADLLPYALMLLQRGRWNDALDAYNEALPHVGTGVLHGHDLLLNESDFLYDHPEPSALEADIRIAYGIELAEDWPFGHKLLPDKGLLEFQKALALNPDSPIANLQYAQGLQDCGRTKDAVAQFQSVANKYDGDVREAAIDGAWSAGKVIIKPQD